LLSPSSNSKINGNQIIFGAIDFQPHPSTLTPIFASLDQKMDLTIRILNFRVGSLGSIHLSGPINSGLSAGKNRVCGKSRIIGGLLQRGKLAGQLEDDGKYRGHS
jgi:hypothetical protein